MAATAEVPQQEGSGESSTDYDALLAAAKAERGDPLASDYDTAADGRSDNVDRDEARALAAERSVAEGLGSEQSAAISRSNDNGEPGQTHHEAFAREHDRNAQESFADARQRARQAGEAYDRAEAARAELEALADPDKIA